MIIERIQPNPRLSAAVTYGDLVFLSGQVPDDASDATGQTAQVLEKSTHCWPRLAATKTICSARPST